MLRNFIRNSGAKATRTTAFRPSALQIRTLADKGPIEEAAQAAGEAKDTNPKVLHLMIFPKSGLTMITNSCNRIHQLFLLVAKLASNSTQMVTWVKLEKKSVAHFLR